VTRGPNWTPSQDALIRNPDRPLPQLAQEMGRPLNALHTRRSQMGWTKNKPPQSPRPVAAAPAPRVKQQALWVRPDIQAEREEPTIRRACLTCRKPFDTTRAIWICEPCKKTEIFGSAM